MAIVDLVMPKLGESIMEATVLKWLKQPGDNVQLDETILEIATDKVDSEVPSTAEGIIKQLFYDVNDVVPIGAVIASIQTANGETDLPLQKEASNTQNIETIEAEAGNESASMPAQEVQPSKAANKFYSPLVMNIASREGISMKDLEDIPGTGNEGRVTKKDILLFVEDKNKRKKQDSNFVIQSRQHAPRDEGKSVPEPNNQLPAVYTGNAEIIEMDRMRRMIAEHMVRSVQTSPHVTSFSEADVTNMVMWRERVKKDFEQREGIKITYMPLFLDAVIRCIKKYPMINSSVEGTRIIIKKDINIGMATATPGGNLIVPVIRNADQLNLVGLTRQVNKLAENARNNKLRPEDIQDGTFTLTNVGTFGSLMGTPIINQPQAAILAVGMIKKRAVVLETAMGDSIAVRHMMYLSMSYDHRIIDGSLGATFLSAVARELENFDQGKEI